MEKNSDNAVIFWKDLIFTALHRWKFALIFGLILALLLGGFKAVSDLKRANNNPLYAEQLEEYEANKQILENVVERQQKDVDNQLSYLENSVFMRLDPFNHYKVKFSIYIDTHYQVMPDISIQPPDTTTYVVNAYQIGLTSNQAIQALAGAVDIEPRYLSEICAVQIPEGANQLTMTIIFPTEAGAQKLLDQLLVEYNSVYARIAQDIQSHDSVILEQSICRSADTNMAKAQSAALNVLQELRTALAKSNENLSSLSSPKVHIFSAKTVVFFAIAGFFAGVILVAVFAWIFLISSQKVYGARAMCAHTNVKLLGSIGAQSIRNSIDRMLYRMEGRDLDPTEERAATLAKDIHCRCQNVRHLVITGDPDPETIRFLTDALSKELPGVKISCHGSILRSSEAIDALFECDKVLLIEKCGVSRYDHISAQCKKVADYKKDLLGCILIDG